MTLLTILTGAPIVPPPPPPPPPSPVGEETPVTTTLGDRLLERLAPLRTGDAAEDRLLGILAHAVMRPVEELHDVAAGRADAAEWQLALDPARAPARSLQWLAQWTGAPRTPDVTRQQIKDHLVLRRGRPASITTAVAATLERTRTVMLTERYQGSAWRLLVQVFAVDTPDAAAAERAARNQTPVGVRLTFEVLGGMTYGQAEARYATYGDVEGAFATYGDAETFTP